MSNLLWFAQAIRDAGAAGEYAADTMEVSAEEAWQAWFDSRPDAWRARLTDYTEPAIRDAFMNEWMRFTARQLFAGAIAANSNEVPAREAK